MLSFGYGPIMTVLGYLAALLALLAPLEQQKRARELGVIPGVLRPGPLNAITDVAGVCVALPAGKVLDICRKYDALRETK